ncbi:MAG: hypothetical protein JO316_02165 [Abitibacteriaceae bacterium]|nr:hypothetical protein [Abditibacteriaceae bacterium]MBV9864133.1 hypothetical protein [Abditibacteriaceae bacterium]
MNLDPQQPTTTDIPASSPDETAGLSDDMTSLPGLSTWPKVYLFVVVVFIAYVVFLTVLSRAFA